MNDLAYYLTRSSGVVALLLVVASLLWGFLFSSRATGTRLRPNWWLDLHNWLGGLALVFTVIHIVLSLFDANADITLLRALVPGANGDQRWAITWGVISTYALVAVVFTTWPTRMTNRRWWRIIHLVSVPATVLAFLHAYQSGSDASRNVFQIGMLAAAAVATYGLGLRLSTLRPVRRSGE
jgi:DMSO/TMAO reductase YedYZ heme-binding membrane subunit